MIGNASEIIGKPCNSTTIAMSGPLSVQILGSAATALLSAIEAGYERAERLRDEHQQRQQAVRAALQQDHARLAQAATEGEAAFSQLIELAGRLGIADRVRALQPQRPHPDDLEALAAYARRLQALAGQVRDVLLTEAARQQRSLADEAPDFGAAQPFAQRLLARIAHLGAPPEGIAELARELERELPGPRADLLATELRARIQAHAEAVQQLRMRQATGLIVDKVLHDLDYQVEEIAETLFVEGGTLHFRKPGWGAYMVRMRVDAKAGTANFNVIRAVEAGSNERSVLDHLAEDRWCAEFPALLRALEAHGIMLQVTRRLQAGEVPVQLVDAAKLPRFADDEQAAPAAKPLTRDIK
jgi:hypothetical protein